MKLAAIDIGSNGARLQISRVLVQNSETTNFQDTYTFKRIEYTRYALRLGKDVFKEQRISKSRQEKLLKLMEVFKLLIELHEADDYVAIATSALRNAENGHEIVKMVRKKVGVDIQVIDGSEEAEILHYIIIKHLEPERNYLHVDVGGGSTEINLYVNQQKVAARSFPMGSIRNIAKNESSETLKQIQKWIERHVQLHCANQTLIGIGTGGNINKIHSLIKPEGEVINTEEIKTLQHYLKDFSFEDKVNILKLNPDRAETIYPASHIYLSAMEWANINEIVVPRVGLKDGMLEMLLQRNRHKLDVLAKIGE